MHGWDGMTKALAGLAAVALLACASPAYAQFDGYEKTAMKEGFVLPSAVPRPESEGG